MVLLLVLGLHSKVMLKGKGSCSMFQPLFSIIYFKMLQAIHLMLYKRWCKMAKIKKV